MFEKAIEIILSEPPELHYPAYYADLLSEADVLDTNVGNCSEIPNSSDLIKRRAAIDALSEAGLINYAATGDGNGMIQAINVIKGLPSAKPEISLLTVKVAPDPEELERIVRKIKDTSVMILPPAEPEQQWIPCSERLPKEKDTGILKKLGTDKRSEYVLATVEVKGERMTVTACTYDGVWHWDKKYAFPDFKVIAWMPMPEPWRGETDD